MKRNLSFDFIRCVAIVFVICIHSMALIDGMVNLSIFPRLVKTVLDTFIYSGVPLFIMLSGSLLLTKEESLSVFFIKRIRRILLPFFLWSMLVYAILYVQEGGRNPMAWFTFFIYKYVTSGVYGIYWYVYLILGLYLITPLLRKILSGGDRSLVFYMVGLVSVIYLFVELFPNVSVTNRFACQNLLYIFYFLWGYIIRVYLQPLAYFKVIARIGLGISCGVFMLTGYVGIPLCNLQLVVSTLFLFSVMVTMKFKQSGIFSDIIRYISKTSYGIYLSHFMFISLFLKFSFVYHIPIAIEPLVMVMLVLFAECILMYAIIRMRLDKWLI